ncbi:hypothetical protein B9Z19DRAFT_1134558 [Tuber borchii]|uniref:Uncharacterized protein n=1 Tax=Tuber borchii TaxID=42251 RepID=A0A2T6ZE36_TUBBO|nr:hypothetical protein B9Z19DRAFT_1134558 [Tuber borchii]
MVFIGFADYNGDSDHNLNNSKTECKGPNLFLATWAKSRNAYNKSDKLDLNALHCKPSYYYQTHEVTVDGTNGSILKADSIGERANFTQQDKIIDIITFERNVAAGATVWQGLDTPTAQISHIIGLSPGKKFDDFRNPMTFRNGVDRMHKLLFNNALETPLVPDSGGEEVVGSRGVRSIGIVVVPQFTHILAGFLGWLLFVLEAYFSSPTIDRIIWPVTRSPGYSGNEDGLGCPQRDASERF